MTPARMAKSGAHGVRAEGLRDPHPAGPPAAGRYHKRAYHARYTVPRLRCAGLQLAVTFGMIFAAVGLATGGGVIFLQASVSRSLFLACFSG
jgi:hypothetical protein